MRDLSHRRTVANILAAALSLVAASAAPVQWSGNGHYYDLIRTNITWHNAKAAAASLFWQGAAGHLATITSALENQFVLASFGASAPAQFAWIGGREPANDGVWRWDSGPEAGVQFSVQATPAGPFNYANWGGIEPNNNKYQEDYLMLSLGKSFNGIAPGRWADASPWPSFSDPVVGYLVEFEPAREQGVETLARNTVSVPAAAGNASRQPTPAPAVPLASALALPTSTNLVIAAIFPAAEVCWTSQPGARYQVQWAGALDSLTWTNLGDPVLAVDGSTCVFDSTRGQQMRFYRIQQAP